LQNSTNITTKMRYEQLYKNILAKRGFLCVGLDPDMHKMPQFLEKRDYPIYEFNREIILHTAPYTVAYKLNTAFYEAYGVKGWQELNMTVKFIREKYPDIFIIADAKRGDIGNTAEMYAKAFFESMDCDAVTLAPYMGGDSIKPFLKFEQKWAIILALTSNGSASDFEMLNVCRSGPHLAAENEEIGGVDSVMPLYERVIRSSMKLGSKENTMFVIGATRPEKLREIRRYAPDNFFLVPGVGAQGGTVREVAENGMNDKCGLLINSSRGIIYASSGEDFAIAAGEQAKKLVSEMEEALLCRGCLQR
jgi:orotidine-5'-phosphate decarboxylase